MRDGQSKNIFVSGAIAPGFIAESIGKHTVKTAIGGHSIFLGQVRADEKDGHRVSAIEYTAYEDMANEKMEGIREVIFEKYAQLEQDALGIWTSPNGSKVAWFKDPDGNILSISEIK